MPISMHHWKLAILLQRLIKDYQAAVCVTIYELVLLSLKWTHEALSRSKVLVGFGQERANNVVKCQISQNTRHLLILGTEVLNLTDWACSSLKL